MRLTASTAVRVGTILSCVGACTSEVAPFPPVMTEGAGASGAPMNGTGGGQQSAGGRSGALGANAGVAAGGDVVSTGGGGSIGVETGGSGGAAGASGAVAAGGSAGGGVSKGNPTFVAVGYAGRRIRSSDLGVTWTDDQSLGGGGDDEFLLRAVGFGAGVFVAVGWKILSSPDGKVWTEHASPQNQWLGGVQFNGTRFVATGGFGYAARSEDGKSWVSAAAVPSNEASRSLAVGLNQFVTATDPGNWFASSDGMSWSLLSGGHQTSQVAFCDAKFSEYDECSGAFNSRTRATSAGVTIRVDGGELERSTNGVDFEDVAGSPGGLESVAIGNVE